MELSSATAINKSLGPRSSPLSPRAPRPIPCLSFLNRLIHRFRSAIITAWRGVAFDYQKQISSRRRR
jgi:hypothetical protein